LDVNKYVLDANVFIEAARRYYAFDLAPKFWESLVHYSERQQISSIDRVKEELDRGKDDLADWASCEFHHAFASTNKQEIFTSYREIMNWVNNQDQFSSEAKSDFADSADGWLIAYAMVNECIVVTHEAESHDIKRKVPIPNVCRQLNIQFVNTFEMLRELGVKFM